MTPELKILFVEDLPTDAELAKRTLTKGEIVFQSRVVDTEANFLRELENFLPDIIISDFKMPQFNGMRALKLRLEKCPTTPFILLTGSMNEDIAVECMKMGATDYIIKEHIARLPLAIKDALEKKKIILAKEKAELELKESEERFRSLYHNSTIGLYRTTPDGKIILANPSMAKMLGYSSFEELAKRDLEKDGFEPSYERKQFLEQIEMNGEVIGLESAWVSKNGTTVFIRESAKAIRNANGKTLYYDGTVEDITERKHNEEKLIASEKRYRDLFNSNPSPMWIYDFDTLAFLEVNNAAIHNYGYSREELLQMNLKDIRPEEDIKKLLFDVSKKRPELQLSGEWKHKLKNGKIIDVEIISHTIEFNGRKAALVLALDITERKRAEEAIQKSEEYYRYIVEATGAVLYHLRYSTMKYDHLDTSIEKLTGYTPAEINEIGFKNIVLKITKYHVEKVDIDLAVSERKQGHTLEWQADYKIKAKDGRLIWLTDYSVPWKDEAGTLIGSIGILTDITERKNAEEEIINAKHKAEELNRAKTNFLQNISHELRTPLNGILGYADLLTSELTEPEQIEMTKGIYNSGKRLSETLNFILDLSEAETGKIEVIAKDIPVVPPVKNIIKSFMNIAAKKNIQIETIVKDEIIYAHLDERLFNRVLHSLLDNAVKFTKEGKISVEVGKEDNDKALEHIYIIVKDTGIGIAPDKIDVIWDEFRQVSEGLSRSYEGTGLGLTIAKKAVELMHGVISVESKLGIGSTFTLKFPARTVIPQKETEEEKPTAAIPPGKQRGDTASLPLVLYVEDDKVNQTVMRLYLRNICNVETANDGVSALKFVAEKKYYLVLMDINLGAGMNGMEVTKEMRKMAEYAETPIIAVTAYAMASKRNEFLNGGCTHFISKPFEKKEIVDLVTSVIRQ